MVDINSSYKAGLTFSLTLMKPHIGVMIILKYKI